MDNKTSQVVPASAQPGKPGAQTEKPVETGKTEIVAAISPFAGLDTVLSTSKSRGKGSVKIRPNVGYTLVAENFKNLSGKSVPAQEAVILKIIKSALELKDVRTAKVGEAMVPVVSEPDLHKLVLAAHANGTLKTTQEAWHIFRYYRSNLSKSVKDGGYAVLREVEIPIAA